MQEVTLFNGDKIRIGNSFELGDLIGEKYKQTRNFDIHVKNPLEIYKYDLG